MGMSRNIRSIHTQKQKITPQQARYTPWIVGFMVIGSIGLIVRPSHDQHVDDYERAKKKLEGAPTVFKGGDQGFVKLKLTHTKEINHNTKELKFEFEDPKSVSGLNVASALLTKFKPEDKEKPVLRPYTPISDEDDPGSLTLLIKRYPNGPMSEHIHSLKVGETLEFKGPLPKYKWETNKHEHVAMIAGGTGITPMYQVIRRIFGNPHEKTKVTLIYGSVSEEDILLRRELSYLESQFPSRFKVFYTLDNPPDSWRQHSGFISKDVLKQLLPDPKEGDKIKVFVCGPPGLYKAISGGKKSPADQGELAGSLQELGYTKDQVYKF